MHEIYSIHEAARTARVSVERLRRGILTGELIAQPVSDDRQYLVRGSDLRAFLGQPEPRKEVSTPQPKSRWWRPAFALAVIGACVIILSQMNPHPVPAVCLNCASVREWAGSHRTPCGTLPYSGIRETHLTDVILRAYPGDCKHEFASPGVLERVSPDHGAISTVSVFDRTGIITRAEQVDPEGAADLIRWALRHGLPLRKLKRLGLSATEPGFADATDFREWFDMLRGTPRLRPNTY